MVARACTKRRPRKKYKFFISYRRFDGSDVSGRLRDWLVRDFDERSVVMDVHDIPAGDDFQTFIEGSIPTCSCLIAIISPKTRLDGLVRAKKAGKPTDFVALELMCALAHDVPVVPVLVKGAKLPQASSLPRELRSLTRFQAIELRSDPDFPGDAGRLIKHLRRFWQASPNSRSHSLTHMSMASPA